MAAPPRADRPTLQAALRSRQLQRADHAARAARRPRENGEDGDVKVGVLTGGGDCPGLNAVIRAVARRSFARGHEVVGVRAGWRGLVDGMFEPLGPREVSGLLPRGRTVLGTSRTNPYRIEGAVDAVLASFEREGLDALVAIGGEDTLGVAARLHAEH